jgi:hypothetical protein
MRYLLFLLILCQTGCFYATRNVYERGLIHEKIERPQGIGFLTDGTPAIPCVAQYYHYGFGFNNPTKHKDDSRPVTLIPNGPSVIKQLGKVSDNQFLGSVVVWGVGAGEWRPMPSQFIAAGPTLVDVRDLRPADQITLGQPGQGFPRSKRHWWGYPLLILCIPAFAVDIITLPIHIPVYLAGLPKC